MNKNQNINKDTTMINTANLVKTYRRYKKPEGIRGSIASLFRREYEEKRIKITFDSAVKTMRLRTGGAKLVVDEPYKKEYEVARQDAKALLAELMEHEPKDIVIEEEEIGIVVERIYQEGGNDNA